MNAIEEVRLTIMSIREGVRAKRLLRALIVLLLSPVLAITGCAIGGDAPSEEFPRFTPGEVREIQNTQLQEFIDSVPVDQVTGMRGPLPAMSPWSCDTDLGGNRSYWKEDTGTYQLPGGAQVYVTDTFDVPRLLEEIAERQEAEGWSVKFLDDYGIAWHLEAPDGYSYYVSHIPVNIDGKNEKGVSI